jgi:hypothetical protein
MASRPPLGIALSDQLGVPQPHYSKGQIIAGILADALAGCRRAAGTNGRTVEPRERAGTGASPVGPSAPRSP